MTSCVALTCSSTAPDEPPPKLPFHQLLPPESPIRRIIQIFEDHNGRRDLEPEDGNYFVDCRADDGTLSSGIAYYKNLIPGRMVGKKPDDFVDVTVGQHVDWETSSSGLQYFLISTYAE